jgi:cell division protein FtsN
VSASPTLRSAEAVADTLVDLGFDAYIQKGYQEKNNTVWYRVRVGTFSTIIEAQNASNAIHSITNFETWIDQVREDL